MPNDKSLPVYILAGGKSSRFGSDKARAELHGEPLLQRIVRVLKPAAKRFTAVADVPGKYNDLGVRTIADEQPNLGPMGGLLTALRDVKEGWLLLTSCDMVALDCAWVDQLLSARTPSSLAVAFKGERIEPLFALYHASLLAPVQAAIVAGNLSPAHLIASVPHVLLALPNNWPALAHINSRAELERAAQTLNCSK